MHGRKNIKLHRIAFIKFHIHIQTMLELPHIITKIQCRKTSLTAFIFSVQRLLQLRVKKVKDYESHYSSDRCTATQLSYTSETTKDHNTVHKNALLIISSEIRQARG